MALWPVELRGETPGGEHVLLDSLHRRDRAEWAEVRSRNRSWLGPWDATSPDQEQPVISFAGLVRHYRREAKAGRMLPFTLRIEGRIVGQMVLFGISYGSLLSASAGYWVDESVAGRGIAPVALALAGDHALGTMGLHRIEVNIRPENANSLAVVRKLAFRDEGVRASYLHIDGAWRDHRTFALTTEDLGGHSLLERLHTNHTSHSGDTPPHVPGPSAQET
ncbi:ribosomal-protein-alanine N-acetyltransferase [Phycicoccus badiiscoriae]|uniref:Ribosomal-protein-alanine N-acetyltransferase n=1 Tax=Pedococcus badiiscoriae TaxID=642776 RepID=A0A852WKQ8_9MICO|nr:GNAT family protein [Pedococcus badiiscoriae]NYG07324.1 ribosomal-protein-alanine N-acetyltransferase [Pedococcus badiiscoriae]